VKRVVVVGGGIAGLACAYELSRGGARVTLVERDRRLGGVVRTERVGEFLVEGGPDSFLATKPWARELCEELGLADRLIPSRARRVYVLSGGSLHPLPEGLFLTVPSKMGPFLRSGLISWRGKLRMAMDLVLPRGPDVEDESLASFVRRRLGREALEKLAEPLMAGIYVASAEELSLRATFPRFADMEREHRSLIRALRRAPPSGNVSPFLSLRGGIGELVDRLVARLEGVTILTGKEVLGLEPSWRVRLADGAIEADAVVLAVPAYEAARLWPGVPEVKYVSTTVVSLGYAAGDVPEGSGFVVPRSEGRRILACTWSSRKFEGRAPEGRLLVRCFVKGEGEGAEEVAREEMREILGLREEPLFARSWVWPRRNPVYAVGHERRMREFEERLPRGLHVAGSGFHGIGIPDCVRDGRATARRVLAEDPVRTSPAGSSSFPPRPPEAR
jgi:oxygen-dependent protoporphyrinogen oxidase